MNKGQLRKVIIVYGAWQVEKNTVKKPAEFFAHYSNSEFELVNRDSYWDFVSA